MGGLTAGVFDLAYAIIAVGQGGRSPLWLCQSVASGLLGPSVFEGGIATGILGACCHFVTAISASIVYSSLGRIVPCIHAHPLATGSLFGMLVYGFVNGFAIPLSAFPLALNYPPWVVVRVCFSMPSSLDVPRSAVRLDFQEIKTPDSAKRDSPKTGPRTIPERMRGLARPTAGSRK